MVSSPIGFPSKWSRDNLNGLDEKPHAFYSLTTGFRRFRAKPTFRIWNFTKFIKPVSLLRVKFPFDVMLFVDVKRKGVIIRYRVARIYQCISRVTRRMRFYQTPLLGYSMDSQQLHWPQSIHAVNQGGIQCDSNQLRCHSRRCSFTILIYIGTCFSLSWDFFR